MGEPTSASHITGEKLDKNNYPAWKFRIKNFLMGKELWELCEGTDAKPAGEAAAAPPAGEAAKGEANAGEVQATKESEQFSENAGITIGADGQAQNLGGNLGITKGSDGSTSVGGENGINVTPAAPAQAQPAAPAPAAPPAEAPAQAPAAPPAEAPAQAPAAPAEG